MKRIETNKFREEIDKKEIKKISERVMALSSNSIDELWYKCGWVDRERELNRALPQWRTHSIKNNQEAAEEQIKDLLFEKKKEDVQKNLLGIEKILTSKKSNKNDLSVISPKTKRNDFIEIKYSGYANNELFDSNIEEDVKKLSPKEKPRKAIIIIGQGMIVTGFDRALENKEFNKEYKVAIKPKEGFGERNRNLIKTIPLAAFTEKKVNPQPGMIFTLDNNLAKIITVSGARVIVDFNNPMAGKELEYRFTITRSVNDEKEKVETVLQLLFKFLPEFEIKNSRVIMKGQKQLAQIINPSKKKFKELTNKELEFEDKNTEKKLKNHLCVAYQ